MATSVPADLLQAAKQAFDNAYTPFSNFNVGAALRTKAGTKFSGSNVENSSYGMNRFAAQSAGQTMVTAGQRGFTELVVFSGSQPPASPCGGCRQVLFEFAPAARVWLVNQAGTVIETTVSDLLPMGFRLGPDPE